MDVSRTDGELDEIRVLLVEDDADDAFIITTYLQSAQAEFGTYLLTRVDNLEKAIRVFKQHPFDLIILDLSLPDSQGVETFLALQEVAHTAAIVVCSGLADKRTAVEMIAHGAQDYIVKGDFDRPMLERRIQYALERRKIQLMKEEFIGIVTHDLRSPLAISKEVVDLLLREGVSETQKQFLEMLNHEVVLLDRMVKDLLMMSTIELGRVKLKKASLDLTQIAEKMAQGYELIAQKKNLTVVLSFPHEPILMRGDSDKIAQVWMNLLANAIHYGEAGAIELAITDCGDRVTCSVQDHGPGIAPENMSKLFGKFERLNNQSEGTGLGLAISKAIVEAHGGDIKAESVVGKGLKIIFTLPKA